MSLSNLIELVNNIDVKMNSGNWIRDRKSYLNSIQEENKAIVKRYSSIFTVITKDDFGAKEMERLKYMLNMAVKVDENKVPEHDASVAVGQRLVDEIVKPQISRNKK